MNVINVVFHIPLIPDRVLPESALPDGAFTS